MLASGESRDWYGDGDSDGCGGRGRICVGLSSFVFVLSRKQSFSNYPPL